MPQPTLNFSGMTSDEGLDMLAVSWHGDTKMAETGDIQSS